jgi:hypothetical protein
MRLSRRRVCSSIETSSPVLDQLDPGLDHRLLELRNLLQEPLGLFRCAEAHHTLDACSVVPAPVEDHDLTGRREVLDVALDVHLRSLAFAGGGQSDDAEHTGAHALGDPLDRASLAGRVPTLEHDADLGPGRPDPLLHRDELAVEAAHLALVVLPLHRLLRRMTLGQGPGRTAVRAAVVVLLLALASHGSHSCPPVSSRSVLRPAP